MSFCITMFEQTKNTSTFNYKEQQPTKQKRSSGPICKETFLVFTEAQIEVAKTRENVDFCKAEVRRLKDVAYNLPWGTPGKQDIWDFVNSENGKDRYDMTQWGENILPLINATVDERQTYNTVRLTEKMLESEDCPLWLKKRKKCVGQTLPVMIPLTPEEAKNIGGHNTEAETIENEKGERRANPFHGVGLPFDWFIWGQDVTKWNPADWTVDEVELAQKHDRYVMAVGFKFQAAVGSSEIPLLIEAAKSSSGGDGRMYGKLNGFLMRHFQVTVREASPSSIWGAYYMILDELKEAEHTASQFLEQNEELNGDASGQHGVSSQEAICDAQMLHRKEAAEFFADTPNDFLCD